MPYDLLVKDCRLVRPKAVVPCSVAVREGRVAALLAPGEAAEARRVIDAGGRHVIPGLIDTHVHFGNAGNPFEQDCRTESRAAATGGVTTLLVFIFPHSLVGQPAPDSFSFDDILPERRRAVENFSLVDVMFHLGMQIPRLIPDIPRYASQYGIRSFKAFMIGRNGLNDGQLLEYFQQVARVPGGVAMVHCENRGIMESAEQRLVAAGRQDLAAWSERSPVFAEIEAIHRALTLAQEAGVERLFIVHVGVGSGTEFLREKRWGPTRLAVETCPHYLLFDKDQDLGVAGKVGPPLKDRSQVQALWDRLLDGTMDVIGSDQLAFTAASKGKDLWRAPSGITGGLAMRLPLLLSEGVRKGRLPITRLVELTSTRAAQFFGLYPRKGALEVGSDADMVLLDEDREVQVTPTILNTFSDYTPYEGYLAHGWAGITIAGGRVIYEGGQVVDAPNGGRLLVPSA